MFEMCVWQLSKWYHGSVAIGLALAGHSLNLAVQDAMAVKKVKVVLETHNLINTFSLQ